MPSLDSFRGFVNSPADAALLIFSCFDDSGRIKPVKRRLDAIERSKVCSGSVFVFCEQDSGMRRWTDGMRWSKSRVEGQFLVYRRIECDLQKNGQILVKRRNKVDCDDKSETYDVNSDISSQTDNVLMKKTFAISIKGRVSHVVRFIL